MYVNIRDMQPLFIRSTKITACARTFNNPLELGRTFSPEPTLCSWVDSRPAAQCTYLQIARNIP